MADRKLHLYFLQGSARKQGGMKEELAFCEHKHSHQKLVPLLPRGPILQQHHLRTCPICRDNINNHSEVDFSSRWQYVVTSLEDVTNSRQTLPSLMPKFFVTVVKFRQRLERVCLSSDRSHCRYIKPTHIQQVGQ